MASLATLAACCIPSNEAETSLRLELISLEPEDILSLRALKLFCISAIPALAEELSALICKTNEPTTESAI